MFPEKFKISAIIKNYETAFIRIFAVNLVHAGKVLAQPGSSTDHLPELGLGAYLFEKYQVDTLRYINAGVHHIHGNRNKGRLVRLFEIVNHGLSIGVVTYDPLGKHALILRI